MTKEQEKLFEKEIKKHLSEAQFQGLKQGAKGILGAVLDMCNNGKSIADIKKFCEESLGMSGMQ